MPITMENVRAALDPDEPDYERASMLGSAALPYLAELIGGSDLLLAAKATYLASRIGGPEVTPILTMAARHTDPSVRVAAAGAARNLEPDLAVQVLPALLTDPDPGIRKVAARSAATKLATSRGEEFRARLVALSRNDPDPAVRGLIRKLIERH